MKKKQRVTIDRVKRFEFTPVSEVRASLKDRPELRDKLREDIESALVEEGVVIDESFKQKVREQWRAQIKRDVREVVDRNPGSGSWYLKRVIEGEPIKVRVEEDPTTKRRSKRLLRE